ncbi:hypothetical protein [Aestuariivivens sediminis]|uniref:hypothetical protein n=1 Tax=Aestuariivivens sediminis TaxID=2913557 RepID=UPI001F5AB0A1|nr:hypothetical protein [Aestuariivivens sediminis]
MKYYLSIALFGLLLVSCKNETKTEASNTSDVHKVIAQEVYHVSEYTYIRGLEEGSEKWIAGPTTNIKVGETFYYDKSMEMPNFQSKELNKTFEMVYFVEHISQTKEGLDRPMVSGTNMTGTGSQRTTVERKDIKIEASESTITIEELLKNKEAYNNKVVRLKGEVTKYNPAIMNVNWIHIQDGSEFNGEFDLTVTTTAEVRVGDVVTVEGKVTLNKDFGAGYKYDIIIENATRIK